MQLLPSSSSSLARSCSRHSGDRMTIEKRNVLMVCKGNICRSPTAEALLRREIEDRGWQERWTVDSAGTTDWFAGELPERRALKVLRENGLTSDHVARPLTRDDFFDFHFILGMDCQNVSDIKKLRPDNSRAVIDMLGRYDPEDDSEIQDPYFRNDDLLYRVTFDRCRRAVRAFLDQHGDRDAVHR